MNKNKHGFGMITFKNGEKLGGSFLENKKHGQFTFYYKNGNYYTCEFRDNV